jgi:hypothetical protein
MKRILFIFLVLIEVILFGNEGLLFPSKDSLNVKQIAQIPTFGDPFDVFVVDTFAYVCMGNNLVILNISNKTNPKPLGFVSLPAIAIKIYISGSYAYVADDYSGLRIINISNPSNPKEVGYYDTSGEAYHVYVSGSYAYVADYLDGLQIIKISDPKRPKRVGNYLTHGWAVEVYVSNNYVADIREGLRIIDTSNPKKPKEVGYYYTPETAFGVQVSGGYIYLVVYKGIYVLKKI